VSNESPVDVFFDNLQVIHTRGAILEETHYYPFGMTMAGISSKALNGITENKKKYNGIEFNGDLDLNVYDAFYRNLDPQTGRFWQIDPKIESFEALSPYAAMINNPIRYNDPLGDSTNPIFTVAAWLGYASNQASNVRSDYIKETSKIDKNSPTAKSERVRAKENARSNTPEPFKTIVENSRPIEGERAKLNDPKINNPTKTNAAVNEVAATSGVLGKGLLVVSAANSITNIATAADPGKQAVRETGSWTGAIAFGEVGGQLGGTIGGAPGAVIGGILFSIAGGILGEKYVDKIMSNSPKLNENTKTILKNAGATDTDIEIMMRTD